MKARSWLGVLTLLGVGNASAHHVWLEVQDNQAQLYFGEFNMNLREVSGGGLLDKVAGLTASVSGDRKSQALVLQQDKQSFSAALPAKARSVVAEVTRYALYDKEVDGGKVKAWYRPAARWISDFTAQQPLLTLDVVPTGAANEFKVFYRGQPLAKAEVTVVAESGWSQEMKTSAQGLVQVNLPWNSLYAVEVHHTDNSSGKRDDEAYALSSFATTLTIRTTKGLPPAPAPTPAAPYQRM